MNRGERHRGVTGAGRRLGQLEVEVRLKAGRVGTLGPHLSGTSEGQGQRTCPRCSAHLCPRILSSEEAGADADLGRFASRSPAVGWKERGENSRTSPSFICSPWFTFRVSVLTQK